MVGHLLNYHKFWLNVDRSGPVPDEVVYGQIVACWTWNGDRLPNQYGVFRARGGSQMAHKISYEISNGPVSDAGQVLHSCDNPSCVNPAHLHAGSQSDNMVEMHCRQRGRTKMSFEAADEARMRRHTGETVTSLARGYGVSMSAMSDLVNNKSWTRG